MRLELKALNSFQNNTKYEYGCRQLVRKKYFLFSKEYFGGKS